MKATIKQFPMDFQVIEQLGFEPSGSGEHVFLWMRKQHTNTDWLAKKIAHCAGVSPRDVGYSGLKDRFAVTSQWFSVYLPGKAEPNWRELEDDNIECLSVTRHRKKLQRGVHFANRFCLTLRDVDFEGADWQQTLRDCQQNGFLNLFGPQRFGHNNKNIEMARALFRGEINAKKRQTRSFALSAARALLFNEICRARHAQGVAYQILPGDVVMFQDNHSIFVAEAADVARSDILPAATLVGQEPGKQHSQPAAIEAQVFAEFHEFVSGCQQFDLKTSYRPIIEKPIDMHWYSDGERTLRLEMSLRRGCFATALLAHCFEITDASVSDHQ